MKKLTEKKTIKEQVFEYLNTHPYANMLELQFQFKNVKESTLHVYAWEYDRTYIPLKKLQKDLTIIYEFLVTKVIGIVNVKLNKAERLAFVRFEQQIDNWREMEGRK